MEDFKDKYHETLDQLLFATERLSVIERREEKTFIVLMQLSALIRDFTIQVDKIQGERKKEWENRIKTLKGIFEQIGAVYLQELYWRKKLAVEQKAVLDLSAQLTTALNRIEQLEKMNEM
jgi:hypothetical protein